MHIFCLLMVTYCDEKGLSIEGISLAEKIHTSFSLLSKRFQPKQHCCLMGTEVLLWRATGRKAWLQWHLNVYAWISKEQRKIERN